MKQYVMTHSGTGYQVQLTMAHGANHEEIDAKEEEKKHGH